MASAAELIRTGVEQLQREVPALERLKLVVRLELRGRGDVQVYRVEAPGPKISKGEPDDARLSVSLARSHFNELVAEGKAKHWRDAYEQGHLKVRGNPDVQRLIGTVIERQMARAKLKKVY
jgi:hypothetical protein